MYTHAHTDAARRKEQNLTCSRTTAYVNCAVCVLGYVKKISCVELLLYFLFGFLIIRVRVVPFFICLIWCCRSCCRCWCWCRSLLCYCCCSVSLQVPRTCTHLHNEPSNDTDTLTHHLVRVGLFLLWLCRRHRTVCSIHTVSIENCLNQQCTFNQFRFVFHAIWLGFLFYISVLLFFLFIVCEWVQVSAIKLVNSIHSLLFHSFVCSAIFRFNFVSDWRSHSGKIFIFFNVAIRFVTILICPSEPPTTLSIAFVDGQYGRAKK